MLNAEHDRTSVCLPQVAFDKHWNLALVDVDERYVRKRFPKTSIFDVDQISKKFDNLDVQASAGKRKTKKVVKKEVVRFMVSDGQLL